MLNIATAIDLVILNCGLDAIADIEIIDERTQWLENSKGTQGNITSQIFSTHYRPYYVIALHYWLQPSNNLIKGEGATFDQNYEVTRRYLQMQQTEDIYLGLDIPEAFKVDTMLAQIKAATDTPTTTQCCTTPKFSIMGF